VDELARVLAINMFVRSLERMVSTNATKKKRDQVWLFNNEEATFLLLAILKSV
jgi:hypothetical protein